MMNYAKCLLLVAFFSYEISLCNDADNLAIGYLHDKVLEETVPELKGFNNKVRALFVIKDNTKRIRATNDLIKFVADTKSKLNFEIKALKMTAAQIKAIKMALGIMERRASQLSQSLIKNRVLKVN